jgi:Family of unknown function (DUF6069)
MRTSTVPPPTPTSRAAVHRRRGLTVAGATAAAMAVWLVARTAGTEPTVTIGGRGPMVVNLPAVVLTALSASLAAWITVSVLERLTRRPRPLWPTLALATLAVSLLPVLSVQADGTTRVALMMMHIAVAAVLIPGLLPDRHGPRRSPQGSTR